MVPLGSLLLPMLVSAVVVFFLSWLIHMVLKYHKSDWVKLANEDGVMEALRKFDIPPGDYMMPCGSGPESMKDPAFLDKFKKGPVAIMTFMPPGKMAMGKSLGLWFCFCLFVSLFAAYIAGHALPAGANYLEVFRFTGATAFAAFGLAQAQDSIWYQRKWSTTFKNMFDALLYGLFTGGVFGSMWPSS
ncbi:MAG TPA: hypothetical protein VF247_07670 [Candidatus Krumholzibacteria bacterium]